MSLFVDAPARKYFIRVIVSGQGRQLCLLHSGLPLEPKNRAGVRDRWPRIWLGEKFHVASFGHVCQIAADLIPNLSLFAGGIEHRYQCERLVWLAQPTFDPTAHLGWELSAIAGYNDDVRFCCVVRRHLLQMWNSQHVEFPHFICEPTVSVKVFDEEIVCVFRVFSGLQILIDDQDVKRVMSSWFRRLKRKGIKGACHDRNS